MAAPVLLNTVGYGDITPKNQKEKVVAILVMCTGVTLVGYVTSSITSLMAIKNAVQTSVQQKKQLVHDVLSKRQVRMRRRLLGGALGHQISTSRASSCTWLSGMLVFSTVGCTASP